MFIGEYQHSVDGKGRLAIPVKFRRELQKGAVVTKGFDHCLFVFTASEFRKLAERLAAAPISKSDARAFSRFMFAGAMEVKTDRQGRVLLPDYLRKYANVGEEVIVTGLMNRIEIWDSRAWEKYRSKMEKDSDRIAERMSDLGI